MAVWVDLVSSSMAQLTGLGVNWYRAGRFGTSWCDAGRFDVKWYCVDASGLTWYMAQLGLV